DLPAWDAHVYGDRGERAIFVREEGESGPGELESARVGRADVEVPETASARQARGEVAADGAHLQAGTVVEESGKRKLTHKGAKRDLKAKEAPDRGERAIFVREEGESGPGELESARVGRADVEVPETASARQARGEVAADGAHLQAGTVVEESGKRKLTHKGAKRDLKAKEAPDICLASRDGKRRAENTMKIKDAKVMVCSPGRNFVTLKITTEDGIYGLGDATLNGRELAVASYLSDHVIPLLVGRDARRIEDTWQYLYKGAYWRRRPVTMCAISAVDTALWDIK